MYTRMLTSFAAVLAASALVADELPSDPSTETVVASAPIVVEASRLGRTAIEMPNEVQVISRREIVASGARTLPELLEKRAGGVFVRKLSDNPALQQLSMRGHGVNSFGRVQVIVDGERLNNPDMDAPDLSRVDLESIDHVEILHGPQTVVHGDSASAGVVNVVVDARDFGRRTAIGMHAGSFGTVGMNVSARGGDSASNVIHSASASYEHSDGWRDNSGRDNWSVRGAVRAEGDDGSFFRLGAFWTKAHYDAPGPLSAAEYRRHPRYSTAHDDWCDRIAYGLSGEGSLAFDSENRLDLSMSLSKKDWRTRSLGSENGADVYAARFNPRFVNSSAIAGHGNEFQTGLDFTFDVIDDAHQGKLLFVDYLRWSAAAFLRDEFSITDSLRVFAGVRGERFSARIESTGAAPVSPSSIMAAGEAGIDFSPLETLKFYAKWSRFYRAPFADEMFVYSSWYIPNFDLDPEYGDSFDFGFEWDFLDEWAISADAYFSRTKKEIMYGGFGGLGYRNLNLPWAVERYGVDWALSWSRDGAGWFDARYSFVDAALAGGPYDSARIPMVPREQLRVSGGVELGAGVSVFGGWRYIGEQPSEADFDKSYPWVKAHSLFDVGIGWEPERVKGLRISFTIDNLFDRRYSDYATYGWFYPGAGRSWMISARYEF